MAGGDGHIVEKTETHGLGGFRMVAGRAGGDEDIVGSAGKHVIHRSHCRTDAGQRRLQAFRRGIGIRLDAVDLAILLRDLPHDGKQMLFRMRQQHRILIGLRRLLSVPAARNSDVRVRCSATAGGPAARGGREA